MSQTLEAPSKRYAKVREEFYRSIDFHMTVDPLGPKTSMQDWEMLPEKEQGGLKEKLKESDETYQKEISRAHKLDVETAKQRQLYLDRRQRFEATLVALKDYLPASEELVTAFEKARNAANVVLWSDPRNFAEANKKLHEVHVSDALKKAADLWNKLEGKARDDKRGKEAYAVIDEARKKLAESRTLLTDRALDAFEARVASVEADLLKSKLDSKAVEATTKGIGVITGDLRRARDSADLEKVYARSNYTAAEEALGALKVKDKGVPRATEEEIAPLQRQLNDAGTLTAAREFTAAKNLLSDLVTSVGNLRDGNAQRSEAWNGLADGLDGLLSKFRDLFNKATSPEVKQTATAIAERLAELKSQQVGIGIGFQDAIDRVKGAEKQYDPLAEREKSFKEFATERNSAKQRIQRLEETVEQAFWVLRSAVLVATKAKENKLADGPFQIRLEQARAGWSERLRTAPDKPTLDEARMQQDLQKIAEDIRAAAANDKLLAAGIADGARERAKLVFDKARAAAERDVAAYAAIDAEQGGTLLINLQSLDARVLKKNSARGYDAARQEVELLAKQARKDAELRKADLEKLHKDLSDLLSPVPALLRQLFEAGEKLKNNDKSKFTLAQQACLQGTYDELAAIGATDQIPLLTTAVVDAGSLKEDLDWALAAAKGTKLPDGKSPYTLSDAKKALADARSKLEKTDVKTYAIVTVTGLTEKIEALEAAMGDRSPSQLEKDVAEIVLDTGKAVTFAEKAKQEVEKLDPLLEAMKKNLGKSPIKDAPNMAAALGSEIATIRSNACFEGGLADAKKAAGKLDERIKAYMSAPAMPGRLPAQLADEEEAKAAEKRKTEVAKAQFDGKADVVRKRIKALKTYSDDKSGLETALDEVVSAAKKGGDPETLLEELRGVETRLQLLSANPYGLGVHARNQLPGVNRRWKQAVADFGSSLDRLLVTIGKIAPGDLDENGKAAVGKTVAGVRALYNPSVFDRPLGILGDEGASETDRSSARETVLRDMRHMAAYVMKDPRMQALARCPFDKSLVSPISELNLSLLDLENNVLVSM